MRAIAEYSDPAELRQVMANAKRLGNEGIYWEAFSRLCRISGRDEPDPLVRDFCSTLAAYEELLSLEKRTKDTGKSYTPKAGPQRRCKVPRGLGLPADV